MTKLAEIEETLRIHNELAKSQNEWLIARVKYFTKIIKFRCQCYESSNPSYAVKCSSCEAIEKGEG